VKGILLLPLVLISITSCLRLAAQDAQVGVSLPMEITADVLDTGRTQISDPNAASLTAGFRVLLMPQIKLGPHWYVYSALQVHSRPFFYQDAYDTERGIESDLLQMFMGYTRSWEGVSVNFKVGKLPSAFGTFPLRYDDQSNPLIDQPLPYTYLALRATPGHENYGLTPVTLYGLPAAEIGLSWRRLDSRFQLTNSSPYNPRSLFESDQHAQWTAGAGYSIRQGLRLGISAYRGPWLNDTFRSFVPVGSNLTDFPATGLGLEAEWARGPWSACGEWQRFVFDFPRFTTSPTPSFGYFELKRIINPRWYAAVRANYQTNNRPVIGNVKSATTFFPNRQAYELVVAFRPSRFQLLKIGYEWMKVEDRPGTHDNVFGIHFVTSINRLSKALK
jgi:hypothetical protein